MSENAAVTHWTAGVATGCEISPEEVEVSAGDLGILYLRSRRSLAPRQPSLPHIFDESARRWPERTFLKQRDSTSGEWRSITYGRAQQDSRAIAQWLLDQGLRSGDVLAILSGPSIEHGIIAVGAQRVQIATAPIAPAYSLLTQDFSKLKGCIERCGVKIAFVDDATAFAPAMRSLASLGVRFIVHSDRIDGVDCTPYADVLAAQPSAAVDVATNAITPQTIARIMQTSGSTGTPKAVPLPQANMTLTIAQCEAVGLLDLGDEQPQFLESMPFNHIMGGNYNFNNMIRLGAALHLDEGKPTPALFGKTLHNLRSISPHVFHTVPAGFVMLCDALERDQVLCNAFFRNLVYMGCGGATLPPSVTERITSLALQVTGREIPIFGFYGATEYSLGTVRYWRGPMEVIGVPLPGTELKLVPQGANYEVRVRSAAQMPAAGYLGDKKASAACFDEEGYFCTGDAVRFHDSSRPHLGLVFAGRLAEAFKLQTGTWVSAGVLRNDLLTTAGGLFDEAVICGLNMPHIAALIWVNGVAARDLLDGTECATEQVLAHPLVRSAVHARVAEFNTDNTSSSRFIRAARIMTTPLSMAAGELTDKGSANQQRVRELRADEVAALFANHPDTLRF